MLHSDCGAYGGLVDGFGDNPALEARLLEQELELAAQCVSLHIPNVEVQAYFADFEGIWKFELPARTKSP